MKRYRNEEIPEASQCLDCGLPYTDPGWVEAVVHNDVWAAINPTYHQHAGLLCITCMARRCAEAGLTDVPVMLSGGIFKAGEEFAIR